MQAMLELMPACFHACDLLRLMALWVQMSAVVDSTAKRLETTPFQVPGLTFTLEQFIAKQGFSRSPAEVSLGPALHRSSHAWLCIRLSPCSMEAAKMRHAP